METQIGDKPPIKLLKKLAEVQGKITSVEKTGRNTHQNYKYAEEKGVLEMLNPLLKEAGLLIIPTIKGIDRSEVERTSTFTEKNVVREVVKRFLMTTVHYEISVIDSESGETVTVSWVGDGEDIADKGIYKAMTSGYKYFLLKFFRIPTDDDVENEAEPKGNATGPRRPVQKKGGPSSKMSATMWRIKSGVKAKVDPETGETHDVPWMGIFNEHDKDDVLWIGSSEDQEAVKKYMEKEGMDDSVPHAMPLKDFLFHVRASKAKPKLDEKPF